MVEQTAHLGAGDVTITLNGTEYVLKPTLNAIQIISRQAGGVRGAIDRVGQWDFDVILRVIEIGLGQKVVRSITDFPKAVYESGLTDTTGGLIGKCIEFLHVLGRGGRPVPDAGNEDQDPPKTN